MEHPVPRPDTINALRFGADAAFALLAGMQLDVFTLLQHGPLSAEQLGVAGEGHVNMTKPNRPGMIAKPIVNPTTQQKEGVV